MIWMQRRCWHLGSPQIHHGCSFEGCSGLRKRKCFELKFYSLWELVARLGLLSLLEFCLLKRLSVFLLAATGGEGTWCMRI